MVLSTGLLGCGVDGHGTDERVDRAEQLTGDLGDRTVRCQRNVPGSAVAVLGDRVMLV